MTHLECNSLLEQSMTEEWDSRFKSELSALIGHEVELIHGRTRTRVFAHVDPPVGEESARMEIIRASGGVVVCTSHPPPDPNTRSKVVSFKLEQLMGCSGVALFRNMRVEDQWQGRGVAKVMQKLKIAAANRAGFALMQCTVRADNTPQIRIMQKFGWKTVSQLKNGRTGNDVQIWVKDVREDLPANPL